MSTPPFRARTLFIALLALTVLSSPHLAAPPGAPPERWAALREAAEEQYGQHSYARALALYEQAQALDLPAPEARWVRFRIADCRWRAEAAAASTDPTTFEQAREELETIIREAKRPEQHDLAWAHAHESLGDFWWTRTGANDWGQAWPHYQTVLEHWAASTQIEPARQHYLRITRAIIQPLHAQPHHYHYHQVPVQVLEDALRIAEPADEAHLHYVLARALQHQGGDWQRRAAVVDHYEAAVAAGRGHDWFDDALYAFAEWMAHQGRVVRSSGGWRQEPDFPRAVALYRQLVQSFDPGESQWVDDAKRRIEQITGTTVEVAAHNVFLPGSEVEYHLGWRNAPRVDLALHAVDLADDLRFSGHEDVRNWVAHVDLAGNEPVRTWTIQTDDDGRHRPGRRTERFAETPEVGAYVLTATTGGTVSRTLVLVSDLAVVTKTDAGRTYVYCCDALSGAPVPDASVRLWAIKRHGSRPDQVEVAQGTTGEDGLWSTAAPSWPDEFRFAAASAGTRQAFATTSAWYGGDHGTQWKLYAFTDRPAYRPDETVQWKLLARRGDGRAWFTPAGDTMSYTITGPQGETVAEGTLKLNDFGSAWASLDLKDSMTLGEYHVRFGADDRQLGGSTLFRLEEYRLPEFAVSVSTPLDDSGRRQAYRLGDRVQAEVRAEHYFGGPVASATVEAVVYQKPFHHHWSPPREYSWCYEPQPEDWRWYGHGQIVHRQTLQTDAEGRAIIAFDTPASTGAGMQYRIEARVTDASRREVSGADVIRVGAQYYDVFVHSASRIHRPGAEVEVDLVALDANDQPVEARGDVSVIRQRWREIWIDPHGRRAGLGEVERLRREGTFDQARWVLHEQGYESETLFTRTLTTDAEGRAVLRFTPASEGFYRVTWRSPDVPSAKAATAPLNESEPASWVMGETTLWVCTRETTVTGYHQGGLEIIADRDTFKPGATAPVLITTPGSDRWVLFSVEAEGIESLRAVHIAGDAKLVEVEITEQHVPNFWMAAAMVSGGELLLDDEAITVPPVEQSLEISVTSDREAYEPQETGMLTITARDHAGRPVAAEIALAMYDDSVSAIQQAYAGDPRAFFFEGRRERRVTTGSTMQSLRYVKLLEPVDEPQVWRDDAAEELMEQNQLGAQMRSRSAGRGGDPGGAREMLYDMDASAAPPAPTMPMSKSARQEVANEAVPAEPEAQVAVRSDFRSTLLWLPDVVTDQRGVATVPVHYADSLTRWRAVARGATTGNRFGMAESTTRTRKPLIARLQGPRFFTAGDQARVAALLNNNTDAPMQVRATLQAAGVRLAGRHQQGRIVDGPATVTIPAGGEVRVEWAVEAETTGEAKLTLTARGGDHADAMVRTLPIHEHGVEKMLVQSTRLGDGAEALLAVELPAARRDGSTELVVQVTPSLAVTMLDALPYLVNYPYGCTEQTLSRFVPAVITARTLRDVGLNPGDAMGRVYGGIDPDMPVRPGRGDPTGLEQLDEAIDAGLSRLREMQHGDGGWGWWKEGDSDRFMTAYVLWGLSLARQADVEIEDHLLQSAASWLDGQIVEEEFNPDRQAWLLHALAVYRAGERAAPSMPQGKALVNLYDKRDQLNGYTRALLALSAHHMNDGQRAKVLAANLANGVHVDRRPDSSVITRGGNGGGQQAPVMGTARWGAAGSWWRWSDGPVEATSFALRALLAIDPGNELIEPAATWLIRNRRGSQWSNTRDTSIAILALSDYLRQSGELRTELAYELSVNGRVVAQRSVRPEDVLAAPSRFTINPAIVRDGRNEIRLRRTGGRGPLYLSTEATFFSTEEPVSPAGNEIFVRRDYYRLVPEPTLLRGVRYARVQLADDDYVQSGERVEVVLTIESKNDYEYLVFEDLKPAGLEAVALRSGEPLDVAELRADAVQRAFAVDEGDQRGHGTAHRDEYTGRRRGVYQELRDRHVAVFIDRLPQGTWEVRYPLRAEVPGRFHALPTLGHAMYVPEIRCNSAEVRMNVGE